MTIDAFLVFEIVLFAAWTVFTAWVVFLGGANWLEDTATAACVVHPAALNWDTTGIRLYVGLGWLGSAVLWLLGG